MYAQPLLVLALGLLTVAADDALDKAKAKDLAAFQGQWRVRWIERDGEKIEMD
jgi:hypothetical protein